MIRNPLFAAVLACFSLASVFAPAQITTDRSGASDATNIKLAKLDLLIKLVPLAISKAQYPDVLLGIEKARQLERDTLKAEDHDLANLDPIISAVIDNAIQKGVYPPRDAQQKVADQLDQMRNRRLGVRLKMVTTVWDQIKTKLNDGQLKAMAGGFSDKFVDPSAKPEDITQDVKIRFFIDRVLLDPLTYDLLLDMSKHAP